MGGGWKNRPPPAGAGSGMEAPRDRPPSPFPHLPPAPAPAAAGAGPKARRRDPTGPRGDSARALVSSAEAAKEVMRTHDIKFAQRPSHPSLAKRLFGTTEWLDGVHKVTDRLMESMIGQHRSKRALEKQKGTTSSSSSEDLLDVLLRVQEDDCTLGFHLSTDAINAFLLNIFLAGSETPATLIEWTMAEMIRNPEVMHKAKSEVRKVFGERGKVEESGIHELAYLKLVIKKTLRLHTPTPLVLPRECREECRIFGYDIPLKTRVLVNVWAISRDPRYWGAEAEKFLPERFLDEKVNFRGTDFEFLPFGAGRRMCPGMTFGLAVVELPLANLLFHFDWKLPGGAEPESLNMDEQFGVSLRKKNHLELIPVVQYNPLPPV
ncbi:unnamed protein product [Linum tenue]|uniref:Cytochrome P450 n=1 Tax=Linum tenue TaxID=586396 RepID=A0AAV0PX24_9ROSI|nr:unnamed protein product [Linum tenue]